MKKKIYTVEVACLYSVEVEADSEDEALQLAEDDLEDSGVPDGLNIVGSFEIVSVEE